MTFQKFTQTISETTPKVLFTLGSMSLGDPCVRKPENGFGLIDCNYEKTERKCQRVRPVTEFNCSCPPEWNILPECTEENFCFSKHNIEGNVCNTLLHFFNLIVFKIFLFEFALTFRCRT